MPKIPRRTQKQFAGAVTPSGNIAKFGSLAAGAPAFSNDPAIIQSLAAFEQGWQSATVGNESPALQDRNAIDFLFAYQAAYLLQQGIPEWIESTTYFVDGFVAVDGVIYISKTDNNLNNAVTDTNNWKTLKSTLGIPAPAPAAGLITAWIVFDGTTGGGFQSYGCSVNKTGTGQYTVIFDIPFTVTPLFVGNCAGLVRPVLPGLMAFSFDTAFLSGGLFSPHDFPYVSVGFYGAQ